MDKYFNSSEQIKDYSIRKLIGEGRYGIVYLAINKQGDKCVIKQLKKNMLKETKDKLFYEEELLRNLNSPKFPKFIEKISEPDLECYVLEYMDGRVFEDLLAIDNYRFSKKEIYEVAYQLIGLIAILEQNNIVHRDIRLPNVLVRENKELVLIDFGLARYIDNKRYFKDMDYWYLGDFLIHLYYTSFFLNKKRKEQPWYNELDLTRLEKSFLKRLLGLAEGYKNLKEIREDLDRMQSNLK